MFVRKEDLRAWWWHRQGLNGALDGASPAEVLQKTGWARSVGGVNPYLTLFSRAGTSPSEAERANEQLEIHELPSARGCTYFVPKSDYALALSAANSSGADAELTLAKKHFGVTDQEISSLESKILKLLKSKPADPRGLKKELGDAVRVFGEEGKKRGLTTTLPIALGRLQATGQIVRMPAENRLDTQKFTYSTWNSPKLIEGDAAFEELARNYFRWIGPASAANFQWFSGLTMTKARAVLQKLDLVPIESESQLLIQKDELKKCLSYQAPEAPRYSLVSCIDSLFLLRRQLEDCVDEGDRSREVFAEKGLRQVGHLVDLPSHAIVDRGQIVGLWEYDTSEKRIVHKTWRKATAALKVEIEKTEAFIAEVGDARSFSLDSPESRKPRIEALRV